MARSSNRVIGLRVLKASVYILVALIFVIIGMVVLSIFLLSPIPDSLSNTTSSPIPATVPTSYPTSVPTLGSAPSTTQLNSFLTTAYAAGNSRMASMQQAWHSWAVPVRSDLVNGATNAQTAGMRSDGATDNTATLQSILNSLPSGSRLYFPPGTYRINGPVSITKSVTLVGAPGTVFDCTRATQNVFTINRGGSTSSKLSGVSFTGLVIEGPGIETTPEMIIGYYLDNFKVSYVKFHNVGVTAIDVRTCSNVLVEDCVFDNVFFSDQGYGVAVIDRSDQVVIRDNFFVTKGRHGVTTGVTGSSQPTSDYVQGVTVEDNYFEYMTEEAVNAHTYHAGAYVVRGNVIKSSNKGIQLASGMADVSNNVMIDCKAGILVWNYYVPSGVKTDRITGNTMINTDYEAIYVTNTDVQIRDNVAKGTDGGSAIVLGGYSPISCDITGNVVEGYDRGLESNPSSSEVSSMNNYLKVFGIFLPF